MFFLSSFPEQVDVGIVFVVASLRQRNELMIIWHYLLNSEFDGHLRIIRGFFFIVVADVAQSHSSRLCESNREGQIMAKIMGKNVDELWQDVPMIQPKLYSITVSLNY